MFRTFFNEAESKEGIEKIIVIEKVDEKIDIKEEIYEIDIDKFKAEAADCETESPDFISEDDVKVNENDENSEPHETSFESSEIYTCSKCPKTFKGLLFLTDHFNRMHKVIENDTKKANFIENSFYQFEYF